MVEITKAVNEREMEKRNNPYMLKTFCGCCKIETAVLALTILHLVFGPVPLFVLLVKRALTVKIYFRYIIHLILSLITLFGLLTKNHYLIIPSVIPQIVALAVLIIATIYSIVHTIYPLLIMMCALFALLQFYICWIYISLIYEYKNRADYRKDYQIISV